MMSSGSDLQSVVREATEQFLVGDAPALAGELTEALIAVSARVGRLRRTIEARREAPKSGDALEGEVRAIDEAFGRSVELARRLAQAIREHSAPGAYTAVTGLTRELGRQLSTALPSPMRLTLRCPTGPVLAAIPPADLRNVLVNLVRGVVEGVAHGRRDVGGELSLEVTETRTSGPEARIVLGHPRLTPTAAAEAAGVVREVVHAWGGSVEPCARTIGGAAVVVLLPSVC
jgi:hypothetical protein